MVTETPNLNESRREDAERPSTAPCYGAWLPITTAPDDGREAIVYRPLAKESGDKPVAVKRMVGGNNFCWEQTVPEGEIPTNPTDGACHATHWMPLPDAP